MAESEDARQGSVAAEGAVQRNEEAHRAIGGLLHALDEAKEPQQIVEAIDALWSLLSGHFSEEEQPDGLFVELVRVRPANYSRLKSLEREHRQILESIEGLREQARDLDRRLNRFEEEKVALSRRVRSHERTETRLVMDTYLVDEGGVG